MKNNEFLTEVLSSDICPENFENTYREYQKYQEAAIKTLIEFHRVCEKNEITYQLAYGSLLGAIRDNGQIPWDYDVDVFVPYSEKDKLISALKKDLDNAFYFYCPEIDAQCRHYIMRVAPKGFRTEALHVDVFYYVGTSADAEQRKQHAESLRKATNARFYKLVNCHEESVGQLRVRLALLRRKMDQIFRSTSSIDRQYRSQCNKYSLEDSALYLSADAFATKYQFVAEWLKHTMLYETAYGVFRISTYYEDILKVLYKDYSKIPPLQSRIDEVIRGMRRFKAYERYD